jgi:hypothetical protein
VKTALIFTLREIMRILILILILIILGTYTASAQNHPFQKIQRLPIQKSKFKFESVGNYDKRILRYDAATGEAVYYDPKPRVVLLDAKSGKYAFKWIGYDGQEKTVFVHRADAIDAVISASVLKGSRRQYVYVYNIQNLPSSPTYISTVSIQTFASDLTPIRTNRFDFAGRMSKNDDMKEGDWVRYGSTKFNHRAVDPGQYGEVKLVSTAPPGLVECRMTGGDIGLYGAGEDMPPELENLLPAYTGYRGWARGYTIGPVDKLRGISQQEQISYLLKVLPQCKQQGWMTAQTLRTYEQLLKQNNLQGVFSRIANDLKSESITTEVFAIIDGMKN